MASSKDDSRTDSMRKRGLAAILGGFVGDAASMGLHWIYDQKKLAEIVGNGDPAFHEPPACPFYTYESGAFSPYGDEALALLRYLAQSPGNEFEVDGFMDAYYSFAKSYTGRLNHISKEFITSFEQGKKYPEIGADDSQANCLVKVPILVARYAGSPQLEEIVEKAVRVHQASDMAVNFALAATRILNAVVSGSSTLQAIESVQKDSSLPASVAESLAGAAQFVKESADLGEACRKFGLSCALPHSFTVPVVALSARKSYADSIRENAIAGGDQCSRAFLIGACLAAEGGIEQIPTEWLQKTVKFSEVKDLAAKLVDLE